MPTIPFFQFDSFTDTAFSGNPAAVCLMEAFESDPVLQAIAAENNLSETAFITPSKSASPDAGVDRSGSCGDFDLRWFTPTVEVDLCGHATLAAGALLLHDPKFCFDTARFTTRSGIFTVIRDGERLSFNFPKLMGEPVDVDETLLTAFGPRPVEILQKDRDYLIVFETEADIIALAPDFDALKKHAPFGFVCTARGDEGEGRPDFVSRGFFPNHGIDEDPVTGSAHSLSAPYWAKKLGKEKLYAKQMSKRGGDLWITVNKDSIQLSGQAIKVIEGQFTYELP